MLGTMAAARPRDDLVARVVAWHNRNPLARRIAPAQVVSLGVVAFPFFVPAGAVPTPTTADAVRKAVSEAALPGSDPQAPAGPAAAAEAESPETPAASATSRRLRARAQAQAGGAPAAALPAALPSAAAAAPARPGSARKGWRMAFVEDLLAPYKPAELARWALRHGSASRPGPADAPARELALCGNAPRGMGVAQLWLFTAAIDLGAQRVRVLVAPADGRAVLGPRIIGRGRAGGWAAVFSGGVAVAATAWMLGPGARGPGISLPIAAVAVAAPASAPVVPTLALAPASSSSPTAAATAAATAAPAPASIPEPTDVRRMTHQSAPPPPQRDVAPPAAERSAKPIKHVAPFLSEAARAAAREAGQAAREASQAARAARTPPAPSNASPVVAGARPAARAAATPAAPSANAWAVSTRNLRTRFESEQMLAAFRDVAYKGGHGSELKLEVLAAGDDWRAVGWPLATRADAERLRAALAARGLKTEVVQF